MNHRKLSLLALLLCLAALLGAGAGSAAAKGKPRQLRIDSVAVGSKLGPLTIRVRAGVHAEVSIWIDGHRVDRGFELAGRHAQSISLLAEDGLHAGKNRIRLRAQHGGTTYEARRTARIPAGALLANAGPDVGTSARGKVQLGTPGAMGGKSGLHYRWSIVKRPHAQAKATLLDADRAQPVFDAKTPGTYVMQLEVNPPGEGPSSFDQVVVPVAPNDPPIGAPIDTMTDRDNAISIAGRAYGGGDCRCTSYVVLERSTRAPVAQGRVTNDGNGISTLVDLANRYGATDQANYMKYLMVLSGPRGIPSDLQGYFGELFVKLGVTTPSPEAWEALGSGNSPGYSVIGIPGAPAGAATVNIPSLPEAGAPADPAAMVGYLQRNQAVESSGAPVYEFVSPDHPTYDTRSASTATSNTMLIDGTPFQASVPAGNAGFQVVALDSLTLRTIANKVLITNGTGDNAANRNLQKTAATELAALVKKPGDPVFLLQTIGKPKGAGPEWTALASQFGRLGANTALVNALDGTNEYALVARAGGEAPAAEASTAYEKQAYNPEYPPARLTGILARGRASAFLPNVGGAPARAGGSTETRPAVNLSMVEIAYQKATAWPQLAPEIANRDEVTAAQRYICEELNFCQPTDSCSEVRECFWQKYESDWHSKSAAIEATRYKAGKGFGEPAFDAVKAELQREIIRVATVKQFIGRLQEPLDRAQIGSYVDLQSIGDTVYNAVQPDATSDSKGFVLGLISKVLLLGTVAGKPVSTGASGISAAFGLASYLSTKSGQPILGTEIKAQSKALAGEMLTRFTAARKALTQLGLLLVSDYGKLEASYKDVDSSWELPEVSVMSDSLRKGAKQWYWEALTPTAYPYLIRSAAPDAKNINCGFPGDKKAWPNQPYYLESHEIVGYNGAGNPVNGVYFFARGIGGGASPNSGRISDEMFRSPTGSNPGLGIDKLSFFSPRVFGRTIHALNNVYGCGVMWLPNIW